MFNPVTPLRRALLGLAVFGLAACGTGDAPVVPDATPEAPTVSVSRYSRVRSRGRQVDLRCTVRRRKLRMSSFITGMTMLATNTIMASPHMPSSIRCSTPLRMVSGSPWPKRTTCLRRCGVSSMT